MLEFYVSRVADESGFGEGETFLGAATVVTDITGHATFDLSFSGTSAPASFITATATDQDGTSTSEFSAAIQVPLPAAVNAPVLARVASYAGRTYVVGSLTDAPNAPFTLKFFAGQNLLGSTSVVTDASGHATFNVSFAGSTAPGVFITATARNQNGDTSDFSAALQVPPVPEPLTFTVNTTDDVDDGAADASHTSL